MNLSEKICVVCCVLYNMGDVHLISLMGVELPNILKPNCVNQREENRFLGQDNWTSCEVNSWEQPGIAIAAEHAASIFSASPSVILYPSITVRWYSSSVCSSTLAGASSWLWTISSKEASSSSRSECSATVSDVLSERSHSPTFWEKFSQKIPQDAWFWI